MMAPKVLALRRDVRVNNVNELFLPHRGCVAPCCIDNVRNIWKQKSLETLVSCHESQAKGSA
jgi:hypothetical protein